MPRHPRIAQLRERYPSRRPLDPLYHCVAHTLIFVFLRHFLVFLTGPSPETYSELPTYVSPEKESFSPCRGVISAHDGRGGELYCLIAH